MPNELNFDLNFLQTQVAPATPLHAPEPGTLIIKVKNSAEFEQALNGLQDRTTILLADGVYPTPGTWTVRANQITIRSESGVREKVIFDGNNARHSMLTLDGGKDFTLADVTFFNGELYGFRIMGDTGAVGTRVHNVKFHNIWTRALKGTHPQRPGDKAENLYSMDEARKRRPSGGSIRHCLFLCDTPKPWPGYHEPDYISGIDMMMLKDWDISDNLFVGIRGPNGGGRGAIFIWVYSEDVRAERNLIVNCDRSICFGNPSGDYPHMTRGIIRDNKILPGANKAIELCASLDSEISNNTIYATDHAYPNTIHVFEATKNASCHHNWVHGHIVSDSETKLDQNLVGNFENQLVNALKGDLHFKPETKTRAGNCGARS